MTSRATIGAGSGKLGVRTARVVASSAGRLATALTDAAAGSFPAADACVEVVADEVGPASAVVAFSAHHFVCGPVDEAWVAAHLPDDDLAAAHGPGFLMALATAIDADIGALDVVMAGTGDNASQAAWNRLRAAGLRRLTGTEAARSTHPRVLRAHRLRDDVAVWVLPDGQAHLVTGRGVAGRLEAAFEVAPAARGQHLGRRLATAARQFASGEPVFMQVAPGNVASLRAVLAADYEPVCAEVLLAPRRSGHP